MQKRSDAARVGGLYMKFGLYKKAMVYFERYLKYNSENKDMVTQLLERCTNQLTETTVSCITLYGLQENTIPDVLEQMALREAPPNADDDIIWGNIVPNILSRLYEQMDHGDSTVSV